MNKNGDLIWSKTIGREDSIMVGKCFCLTKDNEFAIVGQITYISTGIINLLILKVDEEGNIGWTKSILNEKISSGSSIKEIIDGSYIIVGYVQNTIRDSSVLIVKVSREGSLIWIKSYFFGKFSEALSIDETNDGFIITGYCNAIEHKEFDGKIFFLRLNSTGYIIWAKTLSEDSSYMFGRGLSIKKEKKNTGFLFTGYVSRFNSSLNNDLIAGKLNEEGSFLWINILGGQKNDEGIVIQETQNNSYTILGNTESYGAGNSDVLISVINDNGDFLSTRTLGSSNFEVSSSLCETNEGNFILTGYNKSSILNDSKFPNKIFIVKLNSLGYLENNIYNTTVIKPKIKNSLQEISFEFNILIPDKIFLKLFNIESDIRDVSKLITSSNAPFDITLNQIEVDEYQAGTVVGELETKDIDIIDSHNYSFVQSDINDNNKFEIDVTSKLKTRINLKSETNSTLVLYIRTTDQTGLSMKKMINFQIENRLKKDSYYNFKKEYFFYAGSICGILSLLIILLIISKRLFGKKLTIKKKNSIFLIFINIKFFY